MRHFFRRAAMTLLMTLSASVVAWVSEQRMLYCAQQVAETDRKIVEIALSCGYNDLPSFTRAFKRQFGVTPSDYRKNSSLK